MVATAVTEVDMDAVEVAEEEVPVAEDTVEDVAEAATELFTAVLLVILFNLFLNSSCLDWYALFLYFR